MVSVGLLWNYMPLPSPRHFWCEWVLWISVGLSWEGEYEKNEDWFPYQKPGTLLAWHETCCFVCSDQNGILEKRLRIRRNDCITFITVIRSSKTLIESYLYVSTKTFARADDPTLLGPHDERIERPIVIPMGEQSGSATGYRSTGTGTCEFGEPTGILVSVGLFWKKREILLPFPQRRTFFLSHSSPRRTF